MNCLGLVLAASVIAGPGPGDARPGSCDTPHLSEVRAAIGKLRSISVEERDAGSRTLKRLWRAAVPDLKRAAGDGDPEVARRAAEILEFAGRIQALTPAFLAKVPTAEGRLMAGADRVWTDLLLEAVTGAPELKPEDIRPLASLGVRYADTPAGRLAVCDIVKRLDIKEAALDVARLAQEPDRRLRIRVLMALERLGVKETARSVVPLLGDTSS